MFLGICVAAPLLRLGRGAFAGHPVLADEPTAQVDGAAAGRTERERWVLLARLYVGLAGRTTGHAVLVGAGSSEFKRVATDIAKVKD
jgi:hypothetical protein